MLSVASVIPDKGHDVLLDALQTVSDLTWQCVCVGRSTVTRNLCRGSAAGHAMRGRTTGCISQGPLAGAELDRRYAGADLMVLASRAETYGMVITEALAHWRAGGRDRSRRRRRRRLATAPTRAALVCSSRRMTRRRSRPRSGHG